MSPVNDVAKYRKEEEKYDLMALYLYKKIIT